MSGTFLIVVVASTVALNLALYVFLVVKMRKVVAIITEQAVVINLLEKNTNNITTELVKLTGKTEFAKGLKKGKEEEKKHG